MDKSQVKKIITTLGMLIGIVVIGYVILTYIYNYNTNTKTNRQAKDKFADLVLNDVTVGDQANSDILNYYNCYFNQNTTNNLLGGSNISNANYVNNSANIVTRLNKLSGNIDELMVQLNNDILNNIGENYARAHLLNKQREELKKTLNDLPLKNI
jgi:hypothetical protein